MRPDMPFHLPFFSLPLSPIPFLPLPISRKYDSGFGKQSDRYSTMAHSCGPRLGWGHLHGSVESELCHLVTAVTSSPGPLSLSGDRWCDLHQRPSDIYHMWIILLRHRFWCSRSEVEPGILHFCISHRRPGMLMLLVLSPRPKGSLQFQVWPCLNRPNS